ncbi:MAG: phage tail protein [Candidatus Aminicenantes bacterium]|nr:phage tail protein [Candidatus Aminicenantes bacterium]
MSEPFIGEIHLYAFNFPPRGWAKCDGQLLPIAENTALFSLLGTIYGGDGRTTFALPDLRGRVPMHQGNGPGLYTRKIGDKAGAEWTTLAVSQMPAHDHTGTATLSGKVKCNSGTGNADTPVGNSLASISRTNQYSNAGTNADMDDGTVDASGTLTTSTAGGSQPHANMQPYLVINYCIALVGLFPSRS